MTQNLYFLNSNNFLPKWHKRWKNGAYRYITSKKLNVTCHNPFLLGLMLIFASQRFPEHIAKVVAMAFVNGFLIIINANGIAAQFLVLSQQKVLYFWWSYAYFQKEEQREQVVLTRHMPILDAPDELWNFCPINRTYVV